MKKITLSLLVLLSSVFFLTQSVYSQSCENFDTLTVGAGVVEQLGGYWILWNDSNAYDAIVTDAQSNSQDNSFVVDIDDVDIVFQFGDDAIDSGQWLYSHYMYVPTGFSGYFNIQTDPTPAVGWNLELWFKDDSTGYFNGGTSETFIYDMDTWFLVEINYDYSSLKAWVSMDGELVTTFDISNSIGGSDYYGSSWFAPPGAFYDDICFGPGDIYTGIEEPTKFTSNIYPNPARDQITIESESIIDKVRVYDNMGQLVYSGQFDNNQMVVNTSSFIPGMYIVEVTVDGRKVRRKLVVE